MAGGFNGSGTFTNASAAFVPSTVISSSAMNANFSAIAADGLSLVICKDGQTTITGALKGASGSVGLPAYSFAADLDCGMYRIGANNIGLAVNGTKILDIATTGLSVTGTLAVSGAQTFTGQASFPAGFLTGNGTVNLPAWGFTSDPDCGVYRIGTNNIGVAVNAAKVLDIGTTGLNVIGSVQANGTTLIPAPSGVVMVNGTIVESHTGNAATFALKTLAGADPSATDIVYFIFRNVTAATGNYVVLSVTAALSLVVSSGSTLGTVSSNVPFKLWLVAFNDASTVRLGIINCVLGGATPTDVYPLGQFPIATSTAEGGAGGADTAQVFYTGTAVTSKAYVPLCYASYETGVTTAGAWAASPTRVQLYGDGVPLPNTQLRMVRTSTGTGSTGTTTIPIDNTIPQKTEGDQVMTRAITPTSTTHLLLINSQVILSNSGASQHMVAALFQDSGSDALVAASGGENTAGYESEVTLEHMMLAATTSSTTFAIRVGGQANTTSFNGISGTQIFGGVANSFLKVIEIVT